LCTTGDFAKSTDALMHDIDPEIDPGMEGTAYPHLLADRITKESRSNKGMDYVEDAQSNACYVPSAPEPRSSAPSKATCKGTDFVLTAGLPLTDQENEDERVPSQPAKTNVDFRDAASLVVPEPQEAAPSKATRKGTGFVSAADLPLTDEDEGSKAVTAAHKKNVGLSAVPGARNTARSKAAGKGPGIVLTADLPLTDEEDEEEATAAGNSAGVRGAWSVSAMALPGAHGGRTDELKLTVHLSAMWSQSEDVKQEPQEQDEEHPDIVKSEEWLDEWSEEKPLTEAPPDDPLQGGYASAKQEADWQDQDQEDKGGAPASRKRGKVESLDREAGLDLSEHHPKDAVRRFFSRDARRPATAEDYFYNTIGTNEGCVTELVTPAFHNRIYRGDPCETPKKAEASAAQRFCDDPKARFAASMLPPQKYKCRTHARGAGKKRQLRAARRPAAGLVLMATGDSYAAMPGQTPLCRIPNNCLVLRISMHAA
ncbi:unnamed protein product, partial [Symbiodinium sp. KB8]